MAPAAILLGIAFGVFADIVVEVVARASGTSITNPPPALNLALNAIFDLAFVGAALYFVRLRGRLRPTDFGYVRPRWWYSVGVLVVGAITYYVVTFTYEQLLNLHASDKLPNSFGQIKTSTAAMVYAAAFVCVLAPIAEEFFFRGFLWGVLRRWRGPWVAAVLTSLLFGMVHAGSAPLEDLIPLAFFGFVLSMIRWRTGSLYPGMALHSINNALALGIADLSWGGGAIIALAFGSVAMIGALTLPLSAPRPATP
jgi:membrane protease YdiL (CAAX protease family)